MNVRSGRQSDMRFILAMMRQESNAVGFVPKGKLEWGIARGRVLVAAEGRQQLGYIYAGSTMSGVMPIFQTVIAPGCRRREIGAALLARSESLAIAGECWGLECRCRDDLEANQFWVAMGWECLESRPGGAGRGRRINIYERRILGNGRRCG